MGFRPSYVYLESSKNRTPICISTICIVSRIRRVLNVAAHALAKFCSRLDVNYEYFNYFSFRLVRYSLFCYFAVLIFFFSPHCLFKENFLRLCFCSFLHYFPIISPLLIRYPYILYLQRSKIPL